MKKSTKEFLEKDYLHNLGTLAIMRLLLMIIIMVFAGSYLIKWSFPLYRESVFYFIVCEIGKAILITALVTGIVKLFLAKQYTTLIKTGEKIYEEEHKEEVENTLNRLEENILDQTNAMAASASSLDAMQKTDIIRLYKSRNDASFDIKADIQDPNITFLSIIGVSLNDFLRPGHVTFHEAWRTIENHIKENQTNDGHKMLDIRILLINPICDGAYHRSKAEEINHVGIAGRLENDVMDSLNTLYELEHQEIHDQVKFKIRLYNTPPILYLVQTDFVSYVQQYYFWTQHNPNLNIPLIRYQGRNTSETQGASMHDSMKSHFDYLWNNYSVSTHEYLEEHNRGCDEVIRVANIKNMHYMYSDLDKCRDRMSFLINNTKRILYMKGITLKSFFRDGNLFNTLCKKIEKEQELKIKILLIDPESEQAKFRSFREFLFRNPSAKLNNFSDKDRKRQALYRDLEDSIENIKIFLEELDNHKTQRNIQIRLYSSAPESFMLLTDESVLIEQYHYGKIRPSNENPEEIENRLLGGDVPVLEYKKPSKKMLKNNPLRNPYEIFKDHFEYVYNYCSRDV